MKEQPHVRPLAFAILNAVLAYAARELDFGWFAYVPAVVAAIWLLAAICVWVSGKPSRL